MISQERTFGIKQLESCKGLVVGVVVSELTAIRIPCRRKGRVQRRFENVESKDCGAYTPLSSNGDCRRFCEYRRGRNFAQRLSKPHSETSIQVSYRKSTIISSVSLAAE